MTTKLEHSTTSPWLHHFIQMACGKGWCVNIGCTTCGAHDFKNGLARLIEQHTTLSNRCDDVANQLRLKVVDIFGNDTTKVIEVAV